MRSAATAGTAHPGMISFATIRWVTGEVPPAALSVKRPTIMHTLEEQTGFGLVGCGWRKKGKNEFGDK